MRFRFSLDSTSLGPLTLDKNPIGWETMEILIQRGLETHGFFYEQTVQLSFYCGAGKEYIDEVRELEGIDAEIEINIQVACGCDPGNESISGGDYSDDYSSDYSTGSLSVDGDCQWEELYQGILDMKTWKSEKNFTNVDIIESSFFRTVRNRMETLVDFLSTESIGGVELDPFTYGPYELNLHSKAILLASEIEMVSDSYQEDCIPDPSDGDTLYFTLPFDFIALEELTLLITPSPPLLYQASSAPQRKRLYSNDTGDDITIDINYNLQGNIKEFFNRDRSYNLSIVYAVTGNDDPGTEGVILVDYGFQSTLASVVMEQPVSETGSLTGINLPSGQGFYLYLVFANWDGQDNVSPSTTTLGYFDNVESSVSISNVSITDDSVGTAFARFEAGARICQAIADRTDAFRSTYFGRTNSEPFAYDSNGYGSFASILSGFWIRGFPITGDFARTTKMSLGDYFRSNSAIENLGLGIEKIDGDNYVVIERMDHFYDSSTVLLTFNNVPNLVISEAPEYYFGRVNIGYNKWTTEFRNGLEEPNSKRFYDLGIKSVETSKEIISNLVTGGYRIEQARRMQYTDSATTDTDGDDDNHLIFLNRTVDEEAIPTMLDVAEKDENFDSVTNLLSPETSYNLRGAVARNYLRHNDIINPALLKYPGRNVKLMGGEGNYKMTSDFTSDDGPGRWNNESLSEGQNIQWDDANNTDNNPIWIPEIATFKFPLSFTDFKVLKNNPKGVILVSETSENHIPYYLLEVKYVPGNGGLADFKLLRAYQ